jgi:ATP-binding cassette subfamily B protein
MSEYPLNHPLDIRQTITKNRLLGVWNLMAGYKLVYISAGISLTFAALARSGTYLLVRFLTDNVLIDLASGDVTADKYQLLALCAVGLVALAAVMGGFTYLAGRLAAYTAENVIRRLRNYLFDHIQKLPFPYHDKTKTGELIQRSTSDVDALRRFLNDQAIGVVRILVLFFVNFFVILQLNVQLALFSIILIPIIFVISIFFFRQVTKAYDAYQKQDAVLSTTLQENLTGVRVVKAFARQTFEQDKFNTDNWEKYLRGRRLLLMHSGYWPISDILSGIQMLAGFVFAALMAIDGTISVGTYLAYSGLVIWLIWPIRNLGRLIVQTSTGLVSYSRVRDIIEEHQEELDVGGTPVTSVISGAIQFEHVYFQYENDESKESTLSDITFSCQAGQVVALLGTTGSGKTSLVNLLPRFYDYTAGSITVDGIELREYPRHYIRGQIGIVEQEPFLFSRTIRENITYGVNRSVSDDEVVSTAKSAAIHDVITTFPNGYDTLIGERGVTLSGGQKQRLAIARTLLKDPRILILDDATSSVDAETEVAIRMALRSLMRGRTSFIIAHRIQSVMDADLILVLSKGRIVQRGQHSELIIQDGIYRKIYDIQTRIENELEADIAVASTAST